MSIAAAQQAINTLLQVGDQGSPQYFHTVANIGDFAGPSLSGNLVDVTSHSTGVPWRQKIVTLLDNGDISIPVFFIPSSPGASGNNATQFGHNGSTGLLSIFTNRQLREYAVVFPDAATTTWYMQGYISKFNMKAPVAGVLGADTTFSMTSQPILV